MPGTPGKRVRDNVSLITILFLAAFNAILLANGQTPVPGVKQVAVGKYHSLALRDDGIVRCFGSNIYGECNCNELAGAKFVAAGTSVSMVVLENGTVRAFGDSSNGLLNVGSLANYKAIQISIYDTHALILLDDATSRFIGNSWQYAENLPQYLGNIKQVAAGEDFSAYLLNDGTVRVFGDTEYKQLDVIALARYRVVQIAAGLDHGVALLDNGRVKIWGYDHGRRTDAENQINVKQVAAGNDRTFLLFASGHVRAFDSAGTDLSWNDGRPVRQIALGRYHALFLYEDGAIGSWGTENGYGQITVPWDLQRARVLAPPSPPPAPPPPPPPTQTMSTGAIAGIAVGGAFILVAIAGLGYFGYRRKKKSDEEVVASNHAASKDVDLGTPFNDTNIDRYTQMDKQSASPIPAHVPTNVASTDPQMVPIITNKTALVQQDPVANQTFIGKTFVTVKTTYVPADKGQLSVQAGGKHRSHARPRPGCSHYDRPFSFFSKDRIYVDEVLANGWARGISTADGKEGLLPVGVLDV